MGGKLSLQIIHSAAYLSTTTQQQKADRTIPFLKMATSKSSHHISSKGVKIPQIRP